MANFRIKSSLGALALIASVASAGECAVSDGNTVCNQVKQGAMHQVGSVTMAGSQFTGLVTIVGSLMLNKQNSKT